jgi:hypothetical protein
MSSEREVEPVHTLCHFERLGGLVLTSMCFEKVEKLVHTPGRFVRLGGLLPRNGYLVADAVMQHVF